MLAPRRQAFLLPLLRARETWRRPLKALCASVLVSCVGATAFGAYGLAQLALEIVDPEGQASDSSLTVLEQTWGISPPSSCHVVEEAYFRDPAHGTALTVSCDPAATAQWAAQLDIPQSVDGATLLRLRSVLRRADPEMRVPRYISCLPGTYASTDAHGTTWNLDKEYARGAGLYVTADRETGRVYLVEYAGGFSLPQTSTEHA